jgi:hypothetical protein
MLAIWKKKARWLALLRRNYNRKGWHGFQGDSKQTMIDMSVYIDGEEDAYWGIGGKSGQSLHYLSALDSAALLGGASSGEFIYGTWKKDEKYKAINSGKTYRVSAGPNGRVWVISGNNKTYRRDRIYYH